MTNLFNIVHNNLDVIIERKIYMKAVIMCGGVGSRLRPITESVPKPLIKLLNKPVIDIIIEKLISENITDIYLSLGYMATQIIDHCEKKKFNAEIRYCTELTPKGTAGGVKNCISSTDDDILVISGDNVFDFSVADFCSYHFSCDADITLGMFRACDPREYGVVITDEDGSVRSFIEKPDWDLTQGYMINTGIYLMKGELLRMIPDDKRFDFAEDLFPLLFQSEKRFMSYEIDGYWGDIGQIESYRSITQHFMAEVYNNKCKLFDRTDFNNFQENESDSLSIQGVDVTVGKDSQIKGFNVIGDNCKIGEGCSVSGAIIGDNCIIGNNCELTGCVIYDNSVICDNCNIEENAVLGFGVRIGRFSRILSNIKVWPGREITPESIISEDFFYKNLSSSQFDMYGLSGRMNYDISVTDAVKIGQAIASVDCIRKIGFGCDNSFYADVCKSLCLSGARICGKVCYDFGLMFNTQAYFFSDYCSLDAFIFICSENDIIKFTFLGKNGLPVNRKICRQVNNNIRYSSFRFCSPCENSEVFNMKLFTTVYKSYIKKMSESATVEIFNRVECENEFLKDIISEIYLDENNGKMQLLINSNATEFYIVFDNKLFSSDRILSLLCEMELAEGKTVLVPEDAPASIDEISKKYKGKVLRVYEFDEDNITLPENIFTDNIWCFDSLFLLSRLANVLSSTGMNLSELMEYQKDFTVRRNIFDFDNDASEIRKMIENCGAVKNDKDFYYKINCRKGLVRLRQVGNASRIRMIVDASDMETARELTSDVLKKIKDTNIDNIL